MKNKKTNLNKAMLICASLLVGLINSAHGGVIKVGSEYEVSYRMVLDSPTLTGNDIKDVIIFEWNDSNVVRTYSPFTINGSGRTDLVHTVDSLPTSALVLGYLDADPTQGELKRHLYMLADSDYSSYLYENLVGTKFSQIFGVGEQSTIDLLIKASAGNQTELAELSGRVINEFSPAAFDPAGGFRVLKWSPVPPTPPLVAVFLHPPRLLS